MTTTNLRYTNCNGRNTYNVYNIPIELDGSHDMDIVEIALAEYGVTLEDVTCDALVIDDNGNLV